MNTQKLWKKLFSRNNEADEIVLHVSGAMIRHKNPFENIEVPRNEESLSKELIEKWVVPFYLNIHSDINESVLNAFSTASYEIERNVVEKLLGDFNWRTRLCGAFFAAVKGYDEFEETIGNHLLKSEVCYAGTGYCLALVFFNTQKSKEYLIAYLDYYLGRNDLWFDQADVYCALGYLDKESARRFDNKWLTFIKDKPNWSLDRSKENFKGKMATIEKIRIDISSRKP